MTSISIRKRSFLDSFLFLILYASLYASMWAKNLQQRPCILGIVLEEFSVFSLNRI